MFAVIKTGQKQYVITEGQKIKVEKLSVKEKAQVTFDQVLLVAEPEKLVEIGKPIIKKAKVKAQVIKQSRAKKVLILKHKPKKRDKLKKGHRQPFTLVEIKKISV